MVALRARARARARALPVRKLSALCTRVVSSTPYLRILLTVDSLSVDSISVAPHYVRNVVLSTFFLFTVLTFVVDAFGLLLQ